MVTSVEQNGELLLIAQGSCTLGFILRFQLTWPDEMMVVGMELRKKKNLENYKTIFKQWLVVKSCWLLTLLVSYCW